MAAISDAGSVQPGTRVATFRGVRGSIPVSGPELSRHGGHTTCIDIATPGGAVVIIDGGTGITTVEPESDSRGEYHIFLTHYHWDHLQGLLFFPPLLDARSSFTFYGHTWDGVGVEGWLRNALRPPWFPISIDDAPAQKRYVDVGSSHSVGDLAIRSTALQHPQGVTAYRIDGPSRSIVVATDCERGDPGADEALRRLAEGSDVLVHDAQYTPEEYDRFRGWGHSTWRHAVDAAADSKTGELILTSHAPARSDVEIDEIVSRARARFANTRAAAEGLQIPL